MIFFDIDETLLDHNNAEKKGALDFLSMHKDYFDFTEEEFVELWNSLANKHFERYLAREISFQEQRRIRIKEVFRYADISLVDEVADSKFDVYLNLYKENWKAFDDVIPCLDSLEKRGINLGVISNGDLEQQIEKLIKIGIASYFSCVVTSSEIGVSKPNPKIFLQACKVAEKNVKSCFYIGDRFETDALGSKQAGMNGIWLNRKGETFATHEVLVIKSLNELPLIMKV